jgi:hypothetical protein
MLTSCAWCIDKYVNASKRNPKLDKGKSLVDLIYGFQPLIFVKVCKLSTFEPDSYAYLLYLVR